VCKLTRTAERSGRKFKVAYFWKLKYCFLAKKIQLRKIWPPNFGHQILATKFLFVKKLATNREARKILKFGQHLRHNLKNCGCVWMNWDKTCHYLGLPVDFGQCLRHNLTIFWMFVVKLGQDLSLIVFACEIWAAPPA
jgi:hypothetical protein